MTKQANTKVNMLKQSSDDYYEEYSNELKKIIPVGYTLIGHDGDVDSFPTNFTVEDKDGYRYVWLTNHGKKQKTYKKIVGKGFEKAVVKYRFDNFDTIHNFQVLLKKKAQEFALKPTGWFTVFGQSGIGKSHICAALTIELIESGYDVEYLMWVDEMNRIKSNLNEYERWIVDLKKANILYIDDFLKTGLDKRVSDFEVKTAFELLNYRYNNELPTIISSEIDFDTLVTINDALAGRIREMSKSNLIVVGYNTKYNYRLKK